MSMRLATPSFRSISTLLLGVALATSSVACGDDETGDGGSSGSGASGPTCGTAASPETLTLTNLQPAVGSTVANGNIVHAFTVVDEPGQLATFTFILPTTHTAGNPAAGGALQFTVTPQGTDSHYEAAPISWETAPAEVEMTVEDQITGADGCVYGFPTPLFQYSLSAGGGTGGSGGA
jgi:hypothetical protein